VKKIGTCRAKLDAALERTAVAAVPGMMNDTHIGQLLDEAVADLARAIFVAIVHHNDLKIWSQLRYGPIRLLNDSADICPLG
jgi:hypothetical protein